MTAEQTAINHRARAGRPMTRHRETPHGDSTERQPRGKESA